MSETECLICNCVIPENYQSTLMITQSCNCIYKVHDNCIKQWCNIKSKCLICHKPIQLCLLKQHIPFRNQPIYENEQPVEMPPRMSFFKKLFKCCIP